MPDGTTLEWTLPDFALLFPEFFPVAPLPMNRSHALTVALALVSAGAGYFMGLPDGPFPQPRLSPQRAAAPPPLTQTGAPIPLPVRPEFASAHPQDFIGILARDPRLIALRNIPDYPPGIENDLQFYVLLCRWIVRDPQRAAEWFAKQPIEWQTLFAGSAPDNELFPDTTFELLKRVPGPGLSALSYKLVSQLPYDPATLRAVIHAQPSVIPASALRNLWDAWSRADGPAAIAAARRAGLDSVAFKEVLTAASMRWAEEALTEAARLDPSESRAATDSILSRLAMERPEVALHHLQKHPDTPNADEHAGSALNAYLKSGLEFSAEIISLFPENLHPYINTISALNRNDPAAAAMCWSPEMVRPPIDRQKPIITQIAMSYALVDPAAALTWATTVPDAMSCCLASSAAARTAVQSNPRALSVWLDSAPSSPRLDRVLSIMVSDLHDDPEAAYAWAGRFSSPERRASEQSRIVRENPLFFPQEKNRDALKQ